MKRIAIVLCIAVLLPASRASAADKEEIDALVNQFRAKDLKRRARAADDLVKLGAEGVPALSKLLEDRDGAVRVLAAESLGRIGPDAKEAVTGLAGAMKDKDDLLRSAAAAALGQIGAPAVPSLIEILKGKDAEQQSLAAGALKQIGPDAKEAVPTLIDIAKRGGKGDDPAHQCAGSPRPNWREGQGECAGADRSGQGQGRAEGGALWGCHRTRPDRSRCQGGGAGAGGSYFRNVDPVWAAALPCRDRPGADRSQCQGGGAGAGEGDGRQEHGRTGEEGAEQIRSKKE